MKTIILTMTVLISYGYVIKEDSQTYTLESIADSAGLYYEKLGIIRLKKAEWQVIIYIDTVPLSVLHYPSVLLNDVIEKCTKTSKLSNCETILNKDIITTKMSNLLQTEKDVKLLLQSFKKSKKPESQDPWTIRSKRTAPLAIIESITNSLFGLATTDQIDEITKNLDVSFKDQSDLIKFNEKKHIY